jgi:hypothetical protein
MAAAIWASIIWRLGRRNPDLESCLVDDDVDELIGGGDARRAAVALIIE